MQSARIPQTMNLNTPQLTRRRKVRANCLDGQFADDAEGPRDGDAVPSHIAVAGAAIRMALNPDWAC
jgi:hypothetical protein